MKSKVTKSHRWLILRFVRQIADCSRLCAGGDVFFARSTFLLLNIRNVTYASGIEKLCFFLFVVGLAHLLNDEIIQFRRSTRVEMIY